MKKIVALVAAAVALAAVLAGATSPAAAFVATPFLPTADSYVDASKPGSNYGARTTLRTDGSPLRISYLKFDVQSADLSSGILRVFATSSNSSGFAVHSVASSNWGEQTLTYANAPSLGPVLARSGPVVAGNWYTLDIAGAVTANGPVTLALAAAGTTATSYGSRESSSPAELYVPRPAAASQFAVARTGSTYVATPNSGDVSYTGTLKFVVEHAVRDLDDAGGGTVLFGADVYDLGGDWFELYDVDRITFRGAGIDQTILRNSAADSTDTEPFDFSTARWVTIGDMTIEAGGPARSTSDAIDFDRGSNSVVERVKITASRGRGIVFDGKDVVDGVVGSATGNLVRDCVITGIPSDGIELLAASGNRIEGCTVTDVGGHGIQLTRSSSTADQPNKPSSDNVVSGNTIVNSGLDGVNVNSGDRNQLVGNVVRNSSDDVVDRDGIRLLTIDGVSCTANRIADNVATDDQTPKTQRYGLNIGAGCAQTLLGANDFSGNRLGAIFDAGTATQYPGDTTPPSAPAGLTATPGSGGIALTWNASSDDVGVVGYSVSRDGATIATVGATTLAYVDAAVTAGATYTYAVTAHDAAGHTASSASVQATAVAGSSSVTLTPTADSYVEESTPSTNRGTATSLRVDGSPLVRTYLRFDVPALSGPVTKAVLRLYANSASSVGHGVGAASSAWSETALTWATAPVPGPVVATSGPFGAGGYVEVDVTSLVAAGTVGLAVTTTSGTAISYGSRESANPPLLVVTAG